MDDLISRAAAIGCLGNSPEQMCMPWSEVERMLRELPAVDAVPMVHARWKSVKAGASNNYPFWDSKCSECGYTTAMTQTGWLYCPHCGAKMDKE